MRFLSTTFGLLLILLISCSNTNTPIAKEKKKKKEKTYFVLVETSFGEMKLKLYNETPLHRDNFVKLVNEGFYDSLLFHRVIKNFMIQGGDPDSKNAPEGKMLGNGGPGYQINAEFDSIYIHKKGALSAARESDRQNPEKKSSGSQFYIVQGQLFPEDKLTMMLERANGPKKQKCFYEYVNNPENASVKQRLDSINKIGDQKGLDETIAKLLEELEPEFEKLELVSYSDEQKEMYSTQGGTPHLDGAYTVFGEVVEGLNVVDSIGQVQKGKADRPIEDIIMKMKVVRK